MEDDTVLGNLYQNALGHEGYEVSVAINGEEGLEKVKAVKPDLILSDIMMPKMDGLEMLEKLKSKKDTKNIPVIIMSNLASDEDVKEALSLGAVRHIIKKDYGPKEIIEAVKEVLSGNASSESSQLFKASG